MNKERIKALSEQAWESISVQDALDEQALAKFDLKFAELIIRECVDLLMKPEYPMTHPNELSEYNRGWVNGRLLGVEHIQQHFGVK